MRQVLSSYKKKITSELEHDAIARQNVSCSPLPARISSTTLTFRSYRISLVLQFQLIEIVTLLRYQRFESYMYDHLLIQKQSEFEYLTFVMRYSGFSVPEFRRSDLYSRI